MVWFSAQSYQKAKVKGVSRPEFSSIGSGRKNTSKLILVGRIQFLEV